MKLLLPFVCLFSLLFFSDSATAQDFNEQFYSGQPGGYREAKTGSIHNLNDTLAEIRFKGPMMGDNFSFPCSYKFSNDTLFMKQLQSDVDLNRFVEYNSTEYMNSKPDSIYLAYQTYYYDGGNPVYEDLFFEVQNVKTPNSKQCDSHCALIKRPSVNDFTIKLWAGTCLLDQFDVHLSDSTNVVRMSKDILSGGGWWNTDQFIEKIPKTLEIKGKIYILITELDSYSLTFTHSGKTVISKDKQK